MGTEHLSPREKLELVCIFMLWLASLCVPVWIVYRVCVFLAGK